jgi:hypothetical protein
VWRDANDNIRPIKPKDGGIKKIDGVVAGIMSLFGAQQLRQGTPISIEVW